MEGIMPLKDGIEDHIEAYLEEMVGVVIRHPSMSQMPIAAVEAVCRVLAYGMRPVVEVLEESESRFLFRVVSPSLASYIGGCLGNDTNSAIHTGENAITQSNALFGICTDTVMRSYKEGTFILANPLSFRTALPFGKPVRVTIEIGPRRRKTGGTIEAVLEENGKWVMPKAEIEMVRR